jgi:hypothetical protein
MELGRNSSPNSLNHVTDERGGRVEKGMVTTTIKKVSLVDVHRKCGVQRYVMASEIA